MRPVRALALRAAGGGAHYVVSEPSSLTPQLLSEVKTRAGDGRKLSTALTGVTSKVEIDTAIPGFPVSTLHERVASVGTCGPEDMTKMDRR